MFKVFNRKHQQIDILENPQSPVIVDELNGLGELSFSVPTKYKHLELEGYIQVENGQEYVIKEILTQGRKREVKCVLNIEEILGMIHTTFYSRDNNINDTMKIILNGTSWTYNNRSTRTYTRNLYGKVTSSYNMLQLLTTVFDVEFYFDTANKVVHIVDKVGEDKGTYFMSELNLRQLNHDSHTHQLITRVIPLGKDDLTIESVNNGKKWLENHTYSNKVIYGVWQSSKHENASQLKEDAQKYLDELSVPYQSYEIIVADLYRLNQAEGFEYSLGDIITIIDADSETRIKQRVVQRTYNLHEPDKDTLNIANKDRSFQDYYKRLQTVAEMTDSVVNADGTINSNAIGNVPSDKITGNIVADSVVAGAIKADSIQSNQIFSHHISANAISADHIKADSIQTEHLQADSITANHIQAGAIQAGSGIIANGAIGSAQISELDASKLTAGTIDTSDITIAGANQNLRLTGNRLQVFEGIGSNQKERISIGDVDGNGSVYGMRVRGKDGKTVLFDENGVTQQGITDGSITNDKINPNANIDGGKLNINSVINKINSDGSTTIQGNRISVDNKSLSAVISDINTKNTAQDSTISSQASSIKANSDAIKLKVDTQTYTTDKANMTSTMNKNTSDITAMKGQIALKVEQSHINNAVNSLNSTIDTKIANAKSEIQVTTDSIANRVSSTETKVNTVTNDLNNLQVGGRNYFLNSNFTKGTSNWAVGGIKDIGGYTCGYRTHSSTTGESFIVSHRIGTLSDTAVTVSGLACFEGISSKEVEVFLLAKKVGSTKDFDYALRKAFPATNELQHFTLTFTLPSDVDTFYIRFDNNGTSSASSTTLYVTNVKLEKGNKATDWTPAPEDIQSQIDTTNNNVTSLQTRVTTAESKITETAITNTVNKNFYTKTETDSAITSKGYQTSSQVQQTVDKLQVKFAESGGYNLVYNSDFRRGIEGWGSNSPDKITTHIDALSSKSKGGAQLSGVLNTVVSLHQHNLRVNNSMSPITISYYSYVSSSGQDGSTNPYRRAEMIVYYHDGGVSYLGQSNVPSFDTWHRITSTFVPSKPVKQISIGLYNRDTSRQVYYSQVQIELGSIATEWSPNPNEISDGITTIDRNGITVRNTDSSTYTQMDSGSFSVNNNNGGTVAEFAQRSTIPNLTAGDIVANTIEANNIPTSSGNKSWSGRTYYVQGTTGVDAEGRGTSWGNAFRSVQYVLDNYIEDILNDNVSIHVGSSVQGWNCYGRSGRGTLQFYLENDAVVSTEVVIQGCTNLVRIVGTNDRKGTLKKGIVAHNCSFIDIGWVTFRGANGWHASATCNVLFSDFTRGIVRLCDFNSASYCVIVDLGSHMWLYGNKGSNVTNYIGFGAYSRTSVPRAGSDTCPDYTGYFYGNCNHTNLYYFDEGATFTKTPSVGWSPTYTPTQRTSTWNFNKIWSDETLHGWSDRNELIQGYSSAYDTGRWTGYLQMTDGFAGIRNTISGSTNLSGRVYVQRRTSSGAGTGTCCMYASDGTHIANISMARGAGAWFTLNSSVVSKIMNGSITYFYLKNDSNNINTYMKMETLGKIEITYTK